MAMHVFSHPLPDALEAEVPAVMADVGCSADEARKSLHELQRVGLIQVVDGQVTFPLASGNGQRR